MSASGRGCLESREAPEGRLRFFWERRSTPRREAGTALGVVFLLIAGAWALGVSDDVDLVSDLDNNPFKVVTSRCHPAQEWRAEIMRTP